MSGPGRLPEGIVTRRARPEDAEALAHLHLDVWDDAYTGLVHQRILDERREQVADRVHRWHAITAQEVTPLVAFSGDLPVGFTTVGAPRDADVGTEVELWSLYVRRVWWGTGLGRALFDEAVGDRSAYLWVLAGNARAIGFYERQGFRPDGAEIVADEGREIRMVRR